jgi:hypothetical protein
MGKPVATGTDQASRVIVGSVDAAGADASFEMAGDWNLSLWAGAAAGGVVKVQRSFDAGTTWVDCTAGGAVVSLSVPAEGSVSEVLFEPEAGVLYRLNCTSFVGVFNWRASQ